MNDNEVLTILECSSSAGWKESEQRVLLTINDGKVVLNEVRYADDPYRGASSSSNESWEMGRDEFISMFKTNARRRP